MPSDKAQLPEAQIPSFCRRNHIRKLALFGSVLRQDFGPDSDVDVLVWFEPGRTPGMFALVAMEQELSDMLARKVDLRTPEDLSRLFREEVVSRAEVRYAS